MDTGFLPIFWRDMVKFRRMKVMLFVALIQPILWLAFFGISMSSNMDDIASGMPNAADGVEYLTFMAPGIIAMTVLFTCLYSSMFLQLDKQFGILKTMVASPLPRHQILNGLSLSGIVKSLIQAIIIIIFGIIMGVTFFDGYSTGNAIVSLLGIMLFVALLSAGLMFLSCAIAISIESHEGVQGVVTMLTLPMFFASNALYSMTSLPWVLRVFAYLNPLTHFINGVRYFALGETFTSYGTEYTQSMGDVLLSAGFLIVFMAIMFASALKNMKNAKVL